MLDHEHKSGISNRIGHTTASSRNQTAPAADAPPPLLSKKWLYNRFEIPYNTAKSCQQLRKFVFSDELLNALGINEADWKRRQRFTRSETLIIIEFLKL